MYVEQTTRTEMTSALVSDDNWIVQVRQEAGNPHDWNAVALLNISKQVSTLPVIGSYKPSTSLQALVNIVMCFALSNNNLTFILSLQITELTQYGQIPLHKSFLFIMIPEWTSLGSENTLHFDPEVSNIIYIATVYV